MLRSSESQQGHEQAHHICRLREECSTLIAHTPPFFYFSGISPFLDHASARGTQNARQSRGGYLAIAVALFFLYNSWKEIQNPGARGSHEITWHEFINLLLETGQVR